MKTLNTTQKKCNKNIGIVTKVGTIVLLSFITTGIANAYSFTNIYAYVCPCAKKLTGDITTPGYIFTRDVFKSGGVQVKQDFDQASGSYDLEMTHQIINAFKEQHVRYRVDWDGNAKQGECSLDVQKLLLEENLFLKGTISGAITNHAQARHCRTMIHPK